MKWAKNRFLQWFWSLGGKYISEIKAALLPIAGSESGEPRCGSETLHKWGYTLTYLRYVMFSSFFRPQLFLSLENCLAQILKSKLSLERNPYLLVKKNNVKCNKFVPKFSIFNQWYRHTGKQGTVLTWRSESCVGWGGWARVMCCLYCLFSLNVSPHGQAIWNQETAS